MHGKQLYIFIFALELYLNVYLDRKIDRSIDYEMYSYSNLNLQRSKVKMSLFPVT